MLSYSPVSRSICIIIIIILDMLNVDDLSPVIKRKRGEIFEKSKAQQLRRLLTIFPQFQLKQQTIVFHS